MMTVERHAAPDRRNDADLDPANRVPLGPVAQRDLRRIWWRQAANGNRMPAERGVILID